MFNPHGLKKFMRRVMRGLYIGRAKAAGGEQNTDPPLNCRTDCRGNLVFDIRQHGVTRAT